ncbi:MAG: HAD family hydrolase [Chloroflexi bacterium]|nr:HAD family hydrolase [Chloroflexota bacterium]
MGKFLSFEAERLRGQRFEGKDIVLIGDSVRDIDSGKELNAMTIAVATGVHSEKVLAEHQPDFLFRSLKELFRLLAREGFNSFFEVLQMIEHLCVREVVPLGIKARHGKPGRSCDY